MKKEQKFIEFTKDDEAVHVNFVNRAEIRDILMGIAVVVKIVKEETGKDTSEIFKVVNDFIGSAETDKE